MSLKKEGMLWDHFRFVPFLVGLAFGFVAIVRRKPDETERVPKWPHPTTVNQYVYRDRNGLCFQFQSEEVNCDQVKETLKDYPYES